MECLHTRTQELRHLPQLQRASRSLGSSVFGTVASKSALEAPPLYLGHASPTCSVEHTLQSNACSTVQGLGLRVWLVGSSEFRNMLEIVMAFFGVCRVPQGGGLFGGDSFSQAEESTVTFEKCTSSGASVAFGSPLGNEVWGS